MLRFAIVLLFSLPVFASAQNVLETSEPGYYVLGETGQENIQLYTAVSYSKTHSNPYGGFSLTLADAPDLSVDIPDGFANAELLDVYVKPCDSEIWDSSVGTRYEIKYSYENIAEGQNYNLDVVPYSTFVELGSWTKYDCGPAVHNPEIHNREYREVNFGYLVKFTSNRPDETCTSDEYIDRIAWVYPYNRDMWYNVGDIVRHNGAEYQCLVAGWCVTGGNPTGYEPGAGNAWQQAWSFVRSCE